ncbi:hypothetical protein ACSNOI_17025, partial [Actinomadura kijaniata]|uniref:hypothetical protein n=1 Tax=Actinomadura kijaniata TaxID=46161 RepID=UPI003F1C7BEF
PEPKPPLHSKNRPARHRRAQVAVPLAATLAAALLTAPPAYADPCSGGNGTLGCGAGSGGRVGGGGGGNGGGNTGGGSGETGTMPGTDPNVLPGVTGGQQQPAAAPATVELAEMARTTAKLPVPIVHTSPDKKTYVRMRTGLWVDNFVPVETDPISAGDQTVQATATPKSVTWQLGETTLACNDGGSKDGKTCGYTYKRSSTGQPGGAYQITATITWEVTWTCQGAECDAPSGTLADLTMPSAATPLVVSEIQATTRQ